MDLILISRPTVCTNPLKTSLNLRYLHFGHALGLEKGLCKLNRVVIDTTARACGKLLYFDATIDSENVISFRLCLGSLGSCGIRNVRIIFFPQSQCG